MEWDLMLRVQLLLRMAFHLRNTFEESQGTKKELLWQERKCLHELYKIVKELNEYQEKNFQWKDLAHETILPNYSQSGPELQNELWRLYQNYDTLKEPDILVRIDKRNLKNSITQLLLKTIWNPCDVALANSMIEQAVLHHTYIPAMSPKVFFDHRQDDMPF